MGRILSYSVHNLYYCSSLGRTRPNRRADISPFRWVLQMKIKQEKNSSLAVSIYVLAMRKQIEEELESKYSKRIDYLIGANNELARELEKAEIECKKMAEIADSILLSKNEEINTKKTAQISNKPSNGKK